MSAALAFYNFVRSNWQPILIGLLLLAVHELRMDLREAQHELALFKAQTEAAGLQAELDHQQKINASEQEKRNAITALQAGLNSLDAANRGLRAQLADPGRSLVSSLPASANRPDGTACLDRAAADAAVSKFEAGVAGLLEKGGAGIVERDGWHRWYDGQVRAFGRPTD